MTIKILVITLSNLGDIVLTFPAIDMLLQGYPGARVDVVVGPLGRSLLENNNRFNRVVIFDKRQTPWQQFLWTLRLALNGYDLVVDFRQTAMPLFFMGAKRTPVFSRPKGTCHMRDKHLARLSCVHPIAATSAPKVSLSVPPETEAESVRLLGNGKNGQKFVMIAPGSASEEKCWSPERFAQLADQIFHTYGMTIVFVGDKRDETLTTKVMRNMTSAAVNLCGKTDLLQLAAVLKKAVLFIGNDSGPTHLASYSDIPTIALFGPKDPILYGPWGKQGVAIRNNKDCRKCKEPKEDIRHTCMNGISVDDVFLSFRMADNKVLLLDRN